MPSPYENVPVTEWRSITEKLLQTNFLKYNELLEVAEVSWNRLWNTKVGDVHSGFPLIELNPPATIVGYFFEKLFTKELACRHPLIWRGGEGSEKDLHCIIDDSKSIEIKSSGQSGFKIFGNRSYGQKVENIDSAKKDKSGYYITINFYGQKLTLIRFGWIDADDWQAQKSPTGQMAGLKEEVYENKLIKVCGIYMLDAPIHLLEGVGRKTEAELMTLGYKTIGDILNAKDLSKKLQKIQLTAKKQYSIREE